MGRYAIAVAREAHISRHVPKPIPADSEFDAIGSTRLT
jgi:hypothetical protein